ncbi:tetratricopeptide repeat protein 19 homolog, mitochondrial [Cydia amplana]|uniref:tetratricopeptide repeat protein 19 homolog, mitochondrial n=1 Tax=Cydia amplana TaxID=1869771 RepID=UPI002FE528CC
MSSKYRILWNTISKMKFDKRFIQKCINVPFPKVLPKQAAIPCTIGFSLFTWLGFQPKLSAEDELIQTIKHCVLFIQRLQYDKAEQLLHIALRQAQQMNHKMGVTYIYDVMANLALEREQLDKAKQLFVAVTQRIMADGAKEDDPRVVHLSIKLARISHLKKEYSTAQLGYDWCLEKLQRAMGTNPSDDTIKMLAVAEDWCGRLYVDCNRLEEGLKLMVNSLEHMQSVGDVGQEHFVVQLNDIGTVCVQLGRTDESIAYFKQAIEIGKQLPEMEELGTMYVNLGRAYLKKQLVEEARKSCGHGWKLGVQANNKEIKDEAEECIKEVKNMIR